MTIKPETVKMVIKTVAYIFSEAFYFINFAHVVAPLQADKESDNA